MQAGDLNQRIQVMRPLKGRDAFGGEQQTWTTSSAIWAKVEFSETSSGERLEADQLVPFTAAKFTIRYVAGLTSEMRILYDQQEYSILSILPDAKKCWILIETVQVGALREESVTVSDGQSLTDSGGNALVLGFGTPTDSYSAPKLDFPADGGGTFEPD